MSSPVFKKPRLQKRGFFFDCFASMFPLRILSILPLLLLTLLTKSQDLPFNAYGNERWVGDSIIGLPHLGPSEFRFRPYGVIPPPVDLSIPVAKGDSNTYSRLIYRVSTAENQSLIGRVQRPLSPNEELLIDIQRISNRGWMASSQSRYTYGRVFLSKNLAKDRLRWVIDARSRIFDRDINSGLRRPYYPFSEAGDLGLLTNDIQLNSAFNRSTSNELETSIGYRINRRLQFAVIGELSNSRFLYDDDSGNKVYYDSLRSDTSFSEVRDSSSVFQWAVGGRLTYRLAKDSSVNRFLEAEVRQQSIHHKSTYRGRFNTNTLIQLAYRHKVDKLSWNAMGRTYLAGYNQGDIQLNSTFIYHLNKESTEEGTRSTDLELRINAQRVEPAVIFTSYASNFLSFDNELNKMSALDISAGFNGAGSSWHAGFKAVAQAREQFVYMDEALQVQQASDLIAIVGADANAGFKAKGWDLNLRGRYQVNLMDRIYDVPMFVGIADLSYAFPMFKKSVYLKTGADSWYFTEYLARGYMPFNDLYFLQTSEKYGDYLQLNPYVMATVQSVDVKIRVLNATYGLLPIGPMVGPRYPSIPRFIEFQIDWTFKN